MRNERTRWTRLAVAIWLLVTVALVTNVSFAGTTDAQADDGAKTCMDLEGYDTNLEGYTEGEWGSATFTPDDGPLTLVVNDGYTVWLCVKKGSVNNEYGPVVLDPIVGPVTVDVDYPGDFDPEDGFSHYAVRWELTEVTTTTEATTTTTAPETTTTTTAVTTTTAQVAGTTVVQQTTTTTGAEVLGVTIESQDTLPRTGAELALALWGIASVVFGAALWVLTRRAEHAS